jgi:ribonucleotide reductase alpha subunit
MKYTQKEFEKICAPLSSDLDIDLSLGPKDSYNLISLSRLCANRVTTNLDWGILGGRLHLKLIRETAGKTFSESTKKLQLYLNEEYYNFVQNNKKELDSIVNEEKSNKRQAIAIGVLEKSYLLKYNKCGNCKQDCSECENFYVGETPEQLYMRVATYNCMPDIEMIQQAYNYLSDNVYSHATPTMFNAGTLRSQMASCFVLTVEDSLWSIEDHWMYTGEISRASGGIGIDVSKIRHSQIGNSGKSDGVPGVLKPFESILVYVDQSKKRKGSAAAYLSAWHVDIEEFIMMKIPVGQQEDSKAKGKCEDLFYSVWLPDIFMERCEKDQDWTLFCPKRCPGLTEVWGKDFDDLYLRYEREKKGVKTIKAKKILHLVYTAQCKTGVPYICFSDRFNEANMQKNIGLIRSSNLCVSGDTHVLTNKGQLQIKTLQDKTVQVWNGQEFSETVVRKTGENQEMMEIKFSNGSTLNCTPYHKFPIGTSDKWAFVQAKDLILGNTIIPCEFPRICGGGDTFIFESTLLEDNCHCYDNCSCDHNCDCNIVCECKFDDYHPYKEIWADDVDYEDLKLDMQLAGYNPIYSKDKKKLVMHHNSVITVTSIKHLDQKMDTYCFTEEKRGMGIFNGVITGQCSEISLHTSEKEIASCNLASLCLAKFVENGEFNYSRLGEVTRFVVRIMNNLIDRNYYPERIPQIKYANLKNRPLGIGIQGLANTYAKLELLFDSDEARQLNNKIIQTIYYYAVDESANLAQKYGEYDAFEGSPYSEGLLHPDIWKAPNGDRAEFLDCYDWSSLRTKVSKGMRNSTLLALMPTATSSIIAEQDPCFEPFNFIVGSKTLISGQYTKVCKEFVEDMQKLGVWNENFAKQIYYDGDNDIGSAQNIPIPESIKDFPLKVAKWKFLMNKYRTAYEIGARESIIQMLARTPWVCQSQSANWFVSEPSWKKFYNNCIGSWKRGAKTGCYYNRGTSAMKAIAVSACEGCQG